MRSPRLAVLVATCLVALTACAPGSSSDDGDSASIRLVEYPGSAVSWLGYIASKKGYFADNDLKVSTTQLPAGQQGTAALVGRSVDIAVLDTHNLAPLLAKGQKFTLLTNAVTNFWVLVGEKSATGRTLEQELKALKGKSINAPSLGGTGAKQVRGMAKAYGLDPSAIKLVADPTNAALTAGKVQASMTDVFGSCRLTVAGYPELMNFVDPPQEASSYPKGVQSLIGLAGLGYWTTTTWADDHAEDVTAFQKAIQQAVGWATAESNHAELASLIRASKYNVPALNDEQWSDCIGRVADTFDTAYTTEDTEKWSELLREEGVSDGLPPAAQWQAKGLTTS